MEIGKFYAKSGKIFAELVMQTYPYSSKRYHANFNFENESKRFNVMYNCHLNTLEDIFNRMKLVDKGIEKMLDEDTNCKKIAQSADVLICIEKLERQARAANDKVEKVIERSLMDREF